MIPDFCTGRGWTPRVRAYYEQCSKDRRPAITVEPTRGGFCKILLDFFPAGGCKLTPEQKEDLADVVEKYEMFMHPEMPIGSGKGCLEIVITRQMSGLLAQEMRRVVS